MPLHKTKSLSAKFPKSIKLNNEISNYFNKNFNNFSTKCVSLKLFGLG